MSPDFLSAPASLKSWLGTTDHKRIGLMYIVAVTLFFLVGGIAATLIRLELLTPAGDLVTDHTYNTLFTLHGVVMVWFFLVPVIPAGLGNFLLPLMIGARDVAFPRLNLASFYLFVSGAVVTLTAMLVGSVDTGWTFYAPFSSLFANSAVVGTIAGIVLSGFGTIATGINFIVTTHRLRAPGLTWFRLPLFVWTLYATSAIIVLATPVLAVALGLVATERIWGIGIFNPALGGDPLLFQHLFWFYSHPAVYIMILPGMGVVSEVIPCFARKALFGYRFVAIATVGIALFGFLVWGHHMFVAGMSVYAGLVFSLLSFLVAIPSAIKVLNWVATLYKGRIWLKSPMLFALGFVALFAMGGVTGLMLATTAIDVHVHDTYFVVAHFHFIMVGGMVHGYMAGLHFWWPKITGRRYSEAWARFAVLCIFAGFVLTFLPQFVLGYAGMPRRYHEYAPQFQTLNVLSSAGASILAVGYVLPLFYLLWSWKYGPPAGPNPWHATGLEWQTSSPPPRDNFATPPQVTGEPYQYDTDADVEL